VQCQSVTTTTTTTTTTTCNANLSQQQQQQQQHAMPICHNNNNNNNTTIQHTCDHTHRLQSTFVTDAVHGHWTLMICSITHFRNWVAGCNYPGTRTRFQLLSK